METVERAAHSYLADSEGAAAARLRFLQGLWSIQSEAAAGAAAYLPGDRDALAAATANGEPLFASSPPPIPLADYVRTVELIAAHTARSAGLPPEMAKALVSADLATAIKPERLAEATTSPGPLAAEAAAAIGASDEGPLTPATVTFVLVSALVPFLSQAAASAGAVLGENAWDRWRTGDCPACGAPAELGRMGERTRTKGAERKLWCSRCHTEWSYERLRCVRCGTANPDRLRYVHVEGDEAHRLHLCDECRGYLRVVFEDDLRRPLSMVVEDAVSAPLGALATGQGYSPEAGDVAGAGQKGADGGVAAR